jgi:hypothetical protein
MYGNCARGGFQGGKWRSARVLAPRTRKMEKRAASESLKESAPSGSWNSRHGNSSRPLATNSSRGIFPLERSLQVFAVAALTKQPYIIRGCLGAGWRSVPPSGEDWRGAEGGRGGGLSARFKWTYLSGEEPVLSRAPGETRSRDGFTCIPRRLVSVNIRGSPMQSAVALEAFLRS